MATRISGELGSVMSPWGHYDSLFLMIDFLAPEPTQGPIQGPCGSKGFVEYGSTIDDINGTVKTSLDLWATLFPGINDPTIHALDLSESLFCIGGVVFALFKCQSPRLLQAVRRRAWLQIGDTNFETSSTQRRRTVRDTCLVSRSLVDKKSPPRSRFLALESANTAC